MTAWVHSTKSFKGTHCFETKSDNEMTSVTNVCEVPLDRLRGAIAENTELWGHCKVNTILFSALLPPVLGD